MRALPPLLLLPLAALAQPQPDFSKVEIKTTKVAGNVYMLEGSGGNIGATVGDDGVAIVDDQFAPLSGKIRAALAKLSPKPVKFVINTHWHFDHVGGNLPFAETASIFAHENVRKRMETGAKIFTFEVPPADPRALPVVTFRDGLSLWWNGEEIRAIHVPPGHTDGDTVVWFTRSNVVHFGDDFITTGFPIIDRQSGGSVTGFLAALDIVLGQIPRDVKVIPGHGHLASVDDVRKLRSAVDEMVGIVRKGIASGKSVEQMQKEKVLAPWEDWGRGYVKADDFIATIAADLAKK